MCAYCTLDNVNLGQIQREAQLETFGFISPSVESVPVRLCTISSIPGTELIDEKLRAESGNMQARF